MDSKDYYKILGVEKNASAEQIKKSYRANAKKYHPDANPGDKKAEERFKEISEAYEVLGNADNRKKYDDMLAHGGFDPSGYAGGGRGTYSGFGRGGDFSDFFNMFFGDSSGFGSNAFDGFAKSRSGAIDGSDAEAEAEISLFEAMKGTERMIRAGTKKINVKIPKGIADGERIKLSGQGLPGHNGGRNGDLFIKIKIAVQDSITLNGTDIEVFKDVYPWEAALGCEKELALPDSRIKIKIPALIQTGKKIRIPGRGYFNRKGVRGDLFVRIRIVNPEKLTDEARALYTRLRDIYG